MHPKFKKIKKSALLVRYFKAVLNRSPCFDWGRRINERTEYKRMKGGT